MSSYDAIENDRVPDWITATIGTRNEVVVAAGVVEESAATVDKFSKLYRNDHVLFWKGIALLYFSAHVYYFPLTPGSVSVFFCAVSACMHGIGMSAWCVA